MANDYFDNFTRLEKGTKARAESVNSLFDQVETGLDKLPSENALNRGTHNYKANTGAANAYAATLSHISVSYATGQEVDLLIDAADINTLAACTLDVSGIGGISIKYPGGSNPAIGDLVGTCKFRYSGTVWHFISTAVNQPAYAEEWATKAEDDLISTAAGGDGSTDYSSLHHAAKSSSSASAASGSAGAAASSASAASGSAGAAALSESAAAVSASDAAATADFDSHGILAPYKNLIIKNNTTNPTYQVDIDADKIIVEDSSSNRVSLSSVNLTADLNATAGINALDTGSKANSKWYHIWVIYNGTTTASLLSLSSTWAGVTKTNISGYTYAGYVGAIYNDSGGALEEIYQRGKNVLSELKLELNSGGLTTVTPITLEVPDTAKKAILGRAFVLNSTGGFSTCTTKLSSKSTGLIGIIEIGGGMADSESVRVGGIEIELITAQTIYYINNTASVGTYIGTSGWSY